MGDLYESYNPDTHDVEYFQLKALGSDGEYWYSPTNKGDNKYWTYLGTANYWSYTDLKGNIGSIYVYANPFNGDIEHFKLKARNQDGRYRTFPIDKSDNSSWTYMGYR